MVERGGTLNAEEKRLAKRYATFFRIPRLSASSPPESYRQPRKGSTISDQTPYSSRLDMQQQHVQAHVQEEYGTTVKLSAQAGIADYQASMFDPQNFPPLQPNVYDGSSDLDFGFSDFFGGYRDSDFMLAGP